MNADKHGDGTDVHNPSNIVEIDINEYTACAGVIVQEIRPDAVAAPNLFSDALNDIRQFIKNKTFDVLI